MAGTNTTNWDETFLQFLGMLSTLQSRDAVVQWCTSTQIMGSWTFKVETESSVLEDKRILRWRVLEFF